MSESKNITLILTHNKTLQDFGLCRVFAAALHFTLPMAGRFMVVFLSFLNVSYSQKQDKKINSQYTEIPHTGSDKKQLKQFCEKSCSSNSDNGCGRNTVWTKSEFVLPTAYNISECCCLDFTELLFSFWNYPYEEFLIMLRQYFFMCFCGMGYIRKLTKIQKSSARHRKGEVQCSCKNP